MFVELECDKHNECHGLIGLSSGLDTICLPSGEKVTDVSESSCPLRASPLCSPVATFHTRIVLSADPDTICLPSGEKAPDSTLLSCPLRASPLCSPVATFHTRIVMSSDPDTICLPSGEKATELTSDLPLITSGSEGGHSLSMSPEVVMGM